jgi:hypothetical protein
LEFFEFLFLSKQTFYASGSSLIEEFSAAILNLYSVIYKRGVKSTMAQTPESDKKVDDQLKPSKLPSPKRGAFPTPKAEIEKAKPFIPEIDRIGQSASEPVSPHPEHGCRPAQGK